MQSPIIAGFLLMMEQPIFVLFCILLMLGIRVLWVSYRKANPLQPDTPARDKRKRGRNEVTAPAKPATARPKNWTLEVIDTLLIAVVLVFGIVRPMLLQTFFIPSQSMEPTLLIHDQLIANKFVLRFRPPQRGEVIVFTPPIEAIIDGPQAKPYEFNYELRSWLQENSGKIQQLDPAIDENKLLAELPLIPKHYDEFIKRVVALPGDHVHVNADSIIVNGHQENEGLYRNGIWQPENYLPAGQPHGYNGFPEGVLPPGPPPTLAQAEEEVKENPASGQTANDRFMLEMLYWAHAWYTSKVYNTRIAPNLDENHDFVVPPDSVFVMGDNRGNSFDSRFWGVVPLNNVKGRAVCTFWPLNRLKLL